MSNKYVSRVARRTRISFIDIEAVAAIIVGLALVDLLFHLGWGYQWRDVLIGAGIMVWGVIVYGACRLVFRSVGSTGEV